MHRIYRKWTNQERQYIAKQLVNKTLNYNDLRNRFNCTTAQLEWQIRCVKKAGEKEIAKEVPEITEAEQIFKKFEKRKRCTKSFVVVTKEKDFTDLLLSKDKYSVDEAIAISVASIQKLRKLSLKKQLDLEL